MVTTNEIEYVSDFNVNYYFNEENARNNDTEEAIPVDFINNTRHGKVYINVSFTLSNEAYNNGKRKYKFNL